MTRARLPALAHAAPVTAVALAAVALAAAGCGSSSSSNSSTTATHTVARAVAPSSTTSTAKTTTTTSSSSASRLRISAAPNGALRFSTSKLEANAGKVTITMNNPSSAGIAHAVAVEGNGVDQDGQTASPGGTSTVTVTLKPGTYTFYCPVDAHRQAGMQGTLTVR